MLFDFQATVTRLGLHQVLVSYVNVQIQINQKAQNWASLSKYKKTAADMNTYACMFFLSSNNMYLKNILKFDHNYEL